ncbi:MAG TPA: hypothetical protein VGR25_13215 [bacterium]|jgi:hypothetical protein|nr:hypothetical protein [bacterium]
MKLWGGTLTWIAVCTLSSILIGGGVILAQTTGPVTLTLEGHGVFFSREANQAVAIDPQVFVQAGGASAGVGPQNITHAAGFVPARLADPPNTPLYNADGKPLSFTLGQWLGARGTVSIELRGQETQVRVSLSGLVPNGVYSLFRVTFQPTGNTFAPLDGAGTANNFMAAADGTASVTVSTPTPQTHANGVVLVYHSDGQAHGIERGTPGITAHHQLIARVP